MRRHGIKLHSHKGVTVLRSHWFDLDDGADLSVVMVLVKTPNGVQAYIGTGHDHRGEIRNTARNSDEKYVAHWGSKVSRETAESVFGPLDNWTDKEV